MIAKAGPGRFGSLAPILAFAFAAALVGSPAGAEPREVVPVPHPRPDTAGPRVPPPEASPAVHDHDGSEAEPPSEHEACLTRLRAAGVEFDVAAMPASSNAACVIEAPLRIKSIKARSRAGGTILLPDGPIVSCAFAERFAGWLGELAAPLIAGRFSAEVKSVRTGPGYECRNRNRAVEGKLSAHALGKAVDISGFELVNGKTLPVKPNGDDATRAAIDAMRTAACGWFTTVLGPGSDAAHTDHMHVDILQHGSSDRYRICQ
jgi:hypothetical protein